MSDIKVLVADDLSNAAVEIMTKAGLSGGVHTGPGRAQAAEIIGPYVGRAARHEDAKVDEVRAKADFLTLHLPLTAETKNLLGAATLGKMKKGAYLINCARGGVVDEAALYEALKSGQLGGAALDVFEKE